MNPTPRVESIARTIAEEARARFGVGTRVLWFGSWINGEARNNSDLDIAVEPPAGVSADAFAALWSWVDDLPTLYSVDLVNLTEVGDTLRREIEATGREL